MADDLRRLIADYQTHLDTLGAGSAEHAKVRAVLDPPYRLLLTAVAEERPSDLVSLQELFSIIGALRDEASVVVAAPEPGEEMTDLATAIRSPIALLERRMRRLPDVVLLIVEPGAGSVVFIALAGGDASLTERLTVATAGEDFAEAAATLVSEVRRSSEQLIARASTAQALDVTPILAASDALTRATPAAVRDALGRATTVLYAPSLANDVDEIPLELLRPDGEYLGLTRAVARVPSLEHLVAMLAPNAINRVPHPRATVIRAADPPDLDQLDDADEDAEQVAHALTILGYDTTLDRNATAGGLVHELDSGIGLVHYVGHGLAVDAGEQLFVGPDERLAAYELDALDGRATPFVYLSACLVGRGRHLAGGRLKGFAVALLRRGAPGLVAASYVVPDHICAETSIAFYRGVWKASAGEAMRLARVRMSGDGYHPVCWAAFALHGDPYSTVSLGLDTDSAASRTLDWPALLVRWFVTGDEMYLVACRTRLEEAAATHPSHRPALDAVAELIDLPPSRSWSTSEPLVDELRSFDIEGAAAVQLFRSWNRLEALRSRKSSAAVLEECRRLIGSGLSLALRLNDSYAFIAFVAAHVERLTTTLTETTAILKEAKSRLRALDADRAGVQTYRDRIEPTLEGLESAIVLDAPGMLGIDLDLFARADEGDEDALREINSQLRAREAKVDLAVAGGDWTEWMVRYVATDAEPVLNGLMAAVAQERDRASSDTREAADLLWRYLSSFRGEGTADPRLYDSLVERLDGDQRKLKTVETFHIFDQIVSDPEAYPRSLAVEGRLAADSLGHEGAVVYFEMLIAQVDVREGRLAEARDRLLTLIAPLRRLAAEDPAYEGRLETTVTNATNLADYLAGLEETQGH